MTEPIMQLAETIQTAHINHNPSVAHDMNPSTAASQKEPVHFDSSPDVQELASDAEEDEIPISALRPTPRRAQMPPLPDLRFEQSYLASIENAKNWQMVTYITVRDQIFSPLVQGMGWTLVLAGWRYWNRAASFSGQSVGAKIRRWWWNVNNWKLPASGKGSVLRDEKLAADVREVCQVRSG